MLVMKGKNMPVPVFRKVFQDRSMSVLASKIRKHRQMTEKQYSRKTMAR